MNEVRKLKADFADKLKMLETIEEARGQMQEKLHMINSDFTVLKRLCVHD